MPGRLNTGITSNRRVEELKKQRYKLRHGGLNQILQEGRTR